jgi:hypothetical protein
MNAGVSNCIEVHKFWEYSTDLRTNISDRVQNSNIFLKIFYRFRFEFVLYRIELDLVSKCMNIAVTYSLLSKHSLPTLYIKVYVLLFLIRHCLSNTSLFTWSLITFLNNLHFNLSNTRFIQSNFF